MYTAQQIFEYTFFTARSEWDPVLNEPDKFSGYKWVNKEELYQFQQLLNAVSGDGIKEALTFLVM
jgi:hypothetical protein